MSVMSQGRHRVLLLAVLAAAAFAFGSSEARAVGTVLIRPAGAATLRGRITASRLFLDCNVTLSGSFIAGTVVSEGVTIGSVSELASSCTETEVLNQKIARALNLPWPIKLRKLNGVNPRFAVATALTEATLEIGRFSVEVRATHREWEFGGCLFGGEAEAWDVRAPLTLVSGTQYSLGTARGQLSARETTRGCTEFYGASTMEGPYSLEPPSPAQTFTFGTGGEVREGLTPSPVEFGLVTTEGLAKRAVTLASAAGGRVEEIGVASGRYFAVTDPNGCRGSVIAEGGRCIFNVIVAAPAEAERALSDTVTARIGGRRFEATLRATT